MFQLDGSKSLYRKWLFHQTSIYKWLFGVPGIDGDSLKNPMAAIESSARFRLLESQLSKATMKHLPFREGGFPTVDGSEIRKTHQLIW